MAPKFDFKPKDQTKITLFANKGEAIVFWVSVAALLFLAMLFVFRYFTGQQTEAIYQQFRDSRQEMMMKIEELEEENDIIQQKVDSLEAVLKNYRVKLQNGSL